MKKPLKYRELRKRLKRYGVGEDSRRGKGSERMLRGLVDGRLVSFTTRCHNEGNEKDVRVIEVIRRMFHLTPEHGVTDEEFYGR